MRIGRDKTGGAGHIKKHTQGTSNEISFSVLDSMKGQDDETEEDSPLGRISLFTLGPTNNSSRRSSRSGRGRSKPKGAHGATRSAKAARPAKPARGTSGGEVAARRAQRRRGRHLVFALFAILCTIGLVFAAILGYGRYQQMQQRTEDLSAQIGDVHSQYQAVEPFLQLVESTLNTPLPDIDAAALEQQLAEWEERQQRATTKLRVTQTALERMQEHLGGRDLERANSALAAMSALSNALEAGRQVLTQATSAARIYEQAETFMANAMAADAAARSAVAGELTDDAAAQAAIEQSREAIDEFAVARDAVQKVVTQGASLINESGAFDKSAEELLQPFIDYANLRIQAQEQAIEADQGFLALSSQQMRDANASYNDLEAQAADLIAAYRDAYPADIVQRAYEATMAANEQVTAWQTEWARAQQELSNA